MPSDQADDELVEAVLALGVDPGPMLAPDERPGVRARLRTLLGLDTTETTPDPLPTDPTEALAELERRAAAGQHVDPVDLVRARAVVDLDRMQEPARHAAVQADAREAADAAARAVLDVFTPEARAEMTAAYADALAAVLRAVDVAGQWVATVEQADTEMRPHRDISTPLVDEALAQLAAGRLRRRPTVASLLPALAESVHAQRAPLTSEATSVWTYARGRLARPERPFTPPPRRTKPVRTEIPGPSF